MLKNPKEEQTLDKSAKKNRIILIIILAIVSVAAIFVCSLFIIREKTPSSFINEECATFEDDSYIGIYKLPFDQHVYFKQDLTTGSTLVSMLPSKYNSYRYQPIDITPIDAHRCCILWENTEDENINRLAVSVFDQNDSSQVFIKGYEVEKEFSSLLDISYKDNKIKVVIMSISDNSSAHISTYSFDIIDKAYDDQSVYDIVSENLSSKLGISTSEGGHIWGVDTNGNMYAFVNGTIRCIFDTTKSEISSRNVGLSFLDDGVMFYNLDEDNTFLVDAGGNLIKIDNPVIATLENLGYEPLVLHYDDDYSHICGTFITSFNTYHNIIVDHNSYRMFSNLHIPLNCLYISAAILTLIVCLIIILIIAVIVIIHLIMKIPDVCIPTILSLVLRLIPLLIIGFLLSYKSIYKIFELHWESNYQKILTINSRIDKETIDKSKFSVYPIDAQYFRDRITSKNEQLDSDFFDNRLNIPDYGQVNYQYITVYNNEPYIQDNFCVSTIPAYYYLDYDHLNILYSVIQSPETWDEEIVYDSSGTMMLLTPIIENDTVVGIIWCSAPLGMIETLSAGSSNSLMFIVYILLTVLMVIILIVIDKQLQPLKVLKDSMKSMEKGDIPDDISISKAGELAEVQTVFNRLSSRVQFYNDLQANLDKKFITFVPSKAIEAFNQDFYRRRVADNIFGTFIYISSQKNSVIFRERDEDILIKENAYIENFPVLIKSITDLGGTLIYASPYKIFAVFQDNTSVDTSNITSNLIEGQHCDVFIEQPDINLYGSPHRMYFDLDDHNFYMKPYQIDRE